MLLPFYVDHRGRPFLLLYNGHDGQLKIYLLSFKGSAGLIPNDVIGLGEAESFKIMTGDDKGGVNLYQWFIVV